VNDLELAAYLDRGLSAVDRARVESHLAVCAECRDHVTSAKRLLDQANRPRRLLKLGLSATLAAAAVAAFLLINPRDAQRRSTDSTLTRAAAAPPTLTAYGPTGEVSRPHLRFVWGAAASGAAYRLSVSGESGTPVWSASTADTSAALPDSVRLAQAARYYWVVDAITTDGRTVSTGLREFGVRP
jgi:anti-sigma factor RsiW